MRIRLPTSKLGILMVMKRMQMEVMERRFLIRQEEGGAPTSPFLPLLLITPITIPTIIIIIVDILLVLSNSSGTENNLNDNLHLKGGLKSAKTNEFSKKFKQLFTSSPIFEDTLRFTRFGKEDMQ